MGIPLRGPNNAEAIITLRVVEPTGWKLGEGATGGGGAGRDRAAAWGAGTPDGWQAGPFLTGEINKKKKLEMLARGGRPRRPGKKSRWRDKRR